MWEAVLAELTDSPWRGEEECLRTFLELSESFADCLVRKVRQALLVLPGEVGMTARQ